MLYYNTFDIIFHHQQADNFSSGGTKTKLLTTGIRNDDTERNSNAPANIATTVIQARCSATIERSEYETRTLTLNYQIHFVWPDGLTGTHGSLPRVT